mmetsp:Transcript_35835/g.61665  ORF Transcript_35835/g.61665 Transcript_35835/m.61665 type:complete len:288 (+) Transcript_35835:230-1093(+)
MHFETAHAAQHPLLGGFDHQTIHRHYAQGHLKHDVLHTEICGETRHLGGALLLFVFLDRHAGGCRRGTRRNRVILSHCDRVSIRHRLGGLGLLRCVSIDGVTIAAFVLQQIGVVHPALAIVFQSHFVALGRVGKRVVATAQTRGAHHSTVPRFLCRLLGHSGRFHSGWRHSRSSFNRMCVVVLLLRSMRAATVLRKARDKTSTGICVFQGIVQLQRFEALRSDSCEVVQRYIGADSVLHRVSLNILILFLIHLIFAFFLTFAFIFLLVRGGFRDGGRRRSLGEYSCP